MKHDNWLKWACLLAWLCQVYLVVYLPEVADEAYYKRWSEHLDWGYFDHPAGVAWWSFAGGRLLNLLLLPIAWLNFIWASRACGARQSKLIIYLVVWSTPLGLASGVLVTPDAPLLFSWSLAVLGYGLCSYRLMTLGLALGLWSKVMIIPAMSGLLYLCWTDQRLQQRTRYINSLLMSATLLLIYLPQLYWSAHHDWLPWSFQTGRQWRFLSSFEFIGGQFLVGGGVWFFYLILSYKDYLAKLFSSRSLVTDHVDIGSHDRGSYVTNTDFDRLCFFLSAPSMLSFALVSLCLRVEANWTALAWPMGLIWLIEKLSTTKLMKAWRFSLILSVPCLFLPVIHHYIPLQWGPPRDGNKLRACIKKAQTDQPAIRYWVTGRYQEAALLGLKSNQSEYAHSSIQPPATLIYHKAFERRKSQYDLWSRSTRNNDLSKLCQTLWIGPKEWAKDYCLAEDLKLDPHDSECRLKLSRCRCFSMMKN